MTCTTCGGAVVAYEITKNMLKRDEEGMFFVEEPVGIGCGAECSECGRLQSDVYPDFSEGKLVRL